MWLCCGAYSCPAIALTPFTSAENDYNAARLLSLHPPVIANNTIRRMHLFTAGKPLQSSNRSAPTWPSFCALPCIL
ncbi:uncharacterized protein LACBIDRAFT_312199 [Laccaria bicolor S238N-H82]|uniref:Predicted protein n=1 Tax=Laccaria bicolor (strain S238N-H82 / ATCC MYA-4686) TaxID=486041 RepID=B0DVQ5_LACBS|nr:uncharacterized protein LACBIDRAFT_312199 [Laccaria bicolor S238N-H82]EDR01292.1 predicted protein [Laccaria bicolor S238N-H82]|eukprot:XP_001887999.1 predicted protein [Laccaria bicolor S238N-H82]